MTHQRINQWITKTLFVMWSFGIAIILLEVVVTKYLPAPIFEAIRIFSDGAEYELAPNRDLIFIPVPNVRELNAYGSRGKATPLTPDENRKRIVFIGDSVVEGLGVDPGDRYTDLLNERMGLQYEFVNLGVRGYNLVQEVEYLKFRGLAFQPDYVFINLIYNDLDFEGGELQQLSEKAHRINQSAFYRRYYRAHSTLNQWLFKFNIYRYLQYFLLLDRKNSIRTDAHTEAPDTLMKSLDNQLEPTRIHKAFETLEEMRLQQSFGVVMVFLPVATNVEYLFKDLKNLVTQQKYPVIDIDGMLAETLTDEAKDRLFFDSCHLTPDGHKVVAGILERELPTVLSHTGDP